MSRYQAMLRSRSLTVSDTANERRRSDSGCRRWGRRPPVFRGAVRRVGFFLVAMKRTLLGASGTRDRKSTRLNSSHGYISYAVFCLKKKKQKNQRFINNRNSKELSELSMLT